jgi:quercetin dioxygenase-like cupin family protein
VSAPPPIVDDAVADAFRAEREDFARGPESPEGRELGRTVGANVRRQRTARDVDLPELERRSGIRRDLLEALEGGRAVPSLRAVWALATALDVPFGALLGGAPTTSVFTVQRAGRGRVIVSGSGQLRSRALFPESDPRAPEVYELTLAPGAREEAAAHAPGTFEHLVVVRGTLTVLAGDASTRLGPGDALFFRADQAHAYENPTDDEAVAHLVMRYP